MGGLDEVRVDGAPGFAAPLWVLARGARTAEARPRLLAWKEHVQKVQLPVGMSGERELAIGVSDAYMVRVDHWAHILWLNQIALVGHWADTWNRRGGRLWLVWRALLGFPWANGRLGAAIRSVHRKAKVHHRAFVDSSVIEEGAEIGANAVVRLSWIGKGARVEDGAVVNASVLGPKATVASGSTVTAAVLYPEAFAAQHKMQLCVFGEASVAFTGSYFYDVNFARSIQVAHRGKVVDTGERFLSVCLGPWARVAGGVWVASGREVPAGALVVQPTDGVLYKMDEALAARRMVTVGGRAMVDGGAELPSNRPDGPKLLP
jgi:acetyltransferase-like isoleucine patch superfamily enzyme